MDNSVNQDEFTSLWVSAQPMVAAYISSVVRDFHETEDLLQKVATIAFRKRTEYDPSRPFHAWVIGVTRFELLRWRRDKARNRLCFTDETIERLEASHSLVHDELEDRRVALQYCMNKLDPRGQRYIKMRYVQELSPAEMAEELDIPAGTVGVALHRIRKLLGECIQRRVNASARHGAGGGS